MRIAQITDLHLRHHQPGTSAVGSRRSRLMASLLEKAIRQISDEKADLLALTGDLLDAPFWLSRPTPGFAGDDVGYWSQVVEADYRLIKELLDESGLRYMVLPGNHDWNEAMWRVFDPAANAMDVAGRRVLRFCDNEHEGNVAYRFHPQRTDWLAALACADSPPQVHLQHYLITPMLNEGYPHSYGEAASLLDGITRSKRVQLCLSGHYHHGTELLQVNGTHFSTGPSFCEPPFRWRMYDLDDTGVRMSEHALGADAQPSRPVVFLDRDGVINDRAAYHSGPELMNLLPGAAGAIRRLQDAGQSVVVVTNQSCVGMGYVPLMVVLCVHDRMCRLLMEEAGATVDAIYAATGAGSAAVLPHHADITESKPNPTLLNLARRQANLEPGGWMVGDTISDARAARAAGARPILVRTGHGNEQASAFAEEFPESPIVDDLAAAVPLILGDVR